MLLYVFLTFYKHTHTHTHTHTAMDNAQYLRNALLATGKVDIQDKAHMPLVAFSLKKELDIPYTVFEIQDKLRERGYVHTYTHTHAHTQTRGERITV